LGKTLWPHGKMNDIDIDNNGHPLVCGYQAFTGVDADFYAAVLDIPTGYLYADTGKMVCN